MIVFHSISCCCYLLKKKTKTTKSTHNYPNYITDAQRRCWKWMKNEKWYTNTCALALTNNMCCYFFFRCEQACFHAHTHTHIHTSCAIFWQSFVFHPVALYSEFWLIPSIATAIKTKKKQKHMKICWKRPVYIYQIHTFSFAWLHCVEWARWMGKRHEMEILPTPPPLTPFAIVFCTRKCAYA